ncbi:membrane protein [Mycolicibacterium confluentis]|uniref:Membrane protein n=1 Tax=Mycolicibacterium confluentis TaxID=28047 RepID=A0A7I7XYE6_9MYCO|nr:membrane protein [Mycolicibacterium confluentis]
MDDVGQTTTAPSLLPHLWKTTLISGILALILGVLALAWPGKTIIVAAIFFGAYLLVSGLMQVVFAFSLRISGAQRALLLISGLASLVLAVLCFLSLQDSILLLAIWIGIGFVFRGISTTISAISDKTLPARGWEIFFGVVSLVAGIVMLVWPGLSLVTLFQVVGIWLIVLGVFEIVAALRIRTATKVLTSY